MTAEHTPSADEDNVMSLKAPEQLLNVCCGDIIFSEDEKLIRMTSVVCGC